MATHGFVYVLKNEYMDDLYKIGCTERSPHARAAEVSNSTGVPVGFQVLCYAEFENFQLAERQLHQWLEPHRVNASREFFHGCLVSAVSLLWWHPKRLAFCDATPNAKHPLCSELIAMLGSMAEHDFDYFNDLVDPFKKKPEPAESKGFERFLELSLAAPADVESAETKEQDAA